jgi:hypothetical protein
MMMMVILGRMVPCRMGLVAAGDVAAVTVTGGTNHSVEDGRWQPPPSLSESRIPPQGMLHGRAGPRNGDAGGRQQRRPPRRRWPVRQSSLPDGGENPEEEDHYGWRDAATTKTQTTAPSEEDQDLGHHHPTATAAATGPSLAGPDDVAGRILEPIAMEGAATGILVSAATGDNSTESPWDRRLVAIWKIGDECPTPSSAAQQWKMYTHVLVTWLTTATGVEEDGGGAGSGGGTCTDTCEWQLPSLSSGTAGGAGCDVVNVLVPQWREAGLSVWWGIGGPAMGGSDLPVDLVRPACWEFCLARADQTVSALAGWATATASKVDGIVLSYQYHYQTGVDGFLRGAEAVQYLRDVTAGLRSALPPTVSLAHMPLDGDMVVGSEYFTMLVELQQQEDRGVLDYVVAQYYHGIHIPSAANSLPAIVDHFDTLATFLFGGDASRVLMGLCAGGDSCVKAATDYSVDSVQAASLVKAVADVYPCYGGVVFLDATTDVGGVWSTPLLAELQNYHSSTNSSSTCPPINGDGDDVEDMCAQRSSCSECVANVGCSWCQEENSTPVCSSSSAVETDPTTLDGSRCSLTCDGPEDDGVDAPLTSPDPPAPAASPTDGNTSPTIPAITATSDTVVEQHLHVEGLTQQIYGILDLPLSTEAGDVPRSVMEGLFQTYVTGFFAANFGQALFLTSNITITSVMTPNILTRRLPSRSTGGPLLRRATNGDDKDGATTGSLRRMQELDVPEGSSIIITFDQDISYRALITEEILSIEALAASPFQTHSARQDYATMLQGSDDLVLQNIIGVSEIITPPLPPSIAPVMPPITPTTPLPTRTSNPSAPPASIPAGPVQAPAVGGPVQPPATGDNGEINIGDGDNGTSAPSAVLSPDQPSSPPATVIGSTPPVNVGPEPPSTPDAVPTPPPSQMSPTANPVPSDPFPSVGDDNDDANGAPVGGPTTDPPADTSEPPPPASPPPASPPPPPIDTAPPPTPMPVDAPPMPVDAPAPPPPAPAPVASNPTVAPTVPPATAAPTAVPTDPPRTPAPSQQVQQEVTADNPDVETSSAQDEYEDGIFGPNTGFIAVAILFGGLLIVFMITMKWVYGEYAN